MSKLFVGIEHTAVAAKESEGGTGPRSVERQLAWISDRALALTKAAREVPRLDGLLASLEKEAV